MNDCIICIDTYLGMDDTEEIIDEDHKERRFKENALSNPYVSMKWFWIMPVQHDHHYTIY